MQNKYRLRANQYDRETEDEKIRPYRIYYIAVEGNATEKEYFEGLSAYRENLGIHGIVSVEVLQRSSKDGHSAPKQVLELLEEYVSLRNNGIANELSDDDFSSIVSEYGMDFIKRYIENPNSVPIQKRNRLVTKLLTVGYDINYRRYLTITGNNDSASENDDVFCIMIDRDAGSHTPEELQFCLNHCREKSISVLLPLLALNSGYCFIFLMSNLNMRINLIFYWLIRKCPNIIHLSAKKCHKRHTMVNMACTSKMSICRM